LLKVGLAYAVVSSLLLQGLVVVRMCGRLSCCGMGMAAGL
jgi:hypothetical protein